LRITPTPEQGSSESSDNFATTSTKKDWGRSLFPSSSSSSSKHTTSAASSGSASTLSFASAAQQNDATASSPASTNKNSSGARDVDTQEEQDEEELFFFDANCDEEEEAEEEDDTVGITPLPFHAIFFGLHDDSVREEESIATDFNEGWQAGLDDHHGAPHFHDALFGGEDIEDGKWSCVGGWMASIATLLLFVPLLYRLFCTLESLSGEPFDLSPNAWKDLVAPLFVQSEGFVGLVDII